MVVVTVAVGGAVVDLVKETVQVIVMTDVIKPAFKPARITNDDCILWGRLYLPLIFIDFIIINMNI